MHQNIPFWDKGKGDLGSLHAFNTLRGVQTNRFKAYCCAKRRWAKPKRSSNHAQQTSVVHFKNRNLSKKNRYFRNEGMNE